MSLPHPKAHPSYQTHQKQVWAQILLPVLLAAAIIIAVIVFTALATFRDHGDVGRWAAISTIWLVMPVMVAGLLLLIFLIVMVYLVVRLTRLIPPYSYQAQNLLYRIEAGTKRIADMVLRPILLFKEVASRIRGFLGRK